MTKPSSKTIPPVPEDNQSHKGPGSAPSVPLDTTKGHRDDEKHNIREQAAHGNLDAGTPATAEVGVRLAWSVIARSYSA